MLEVPVYNTAGEQIEALQIAEECFGTRVNAVLLKQAVVAYHANRRRSAAATKGRAQVVGSTRKLFRQKGTGNARRGSIRANILRGGGVAFAKRGRSFRKKLPKEMRRKALESAILAKILGRNLLVVDGLVVEEPKTKLVAEVLSNLKIDRSCLLTIPDHDDVLWKSARNLPDLAVRAARELNAFDVVTRQKMLVTREAMDLLLQQPA